MLLLAPGVVAIGVGRGTTPAGAERLARRLFEAGLVHAVLAVPLREHGAGGRLDTLCAVIDTDSVLMHPGVAYALTAHTISPRADGLRASRPQPFLQAAAQAMGIDRLHVIDSGVDPQWGRSASADDGSNVLAIGRRVVVSHERNSETNARLEHAGVRVIRVPASELGSMRGGPRCMTCPVGRDPAAQGAADAPAARPAPASGRAADLTIPRISISGRSGVSQPAAVPAALTAAAASAGGAGVSPADLAADLSPRPGWRPGRP